MEKSNAADPPASATTQHEAEASLPSERLEIGVWNDESIMSDEAAPIPARFWWLKRLSIAGAVIIVALIGLRWYWGYEMTRRIESAVAAIEAKGEPIRFDDMRHPPVPDADNKAYYLRQAMANWPLVDGVRVTDTAWHSDPKQHPDPVTDNAAYLARCEPVFDLLRQAEAAPQTDWGVQLVNPPIQILLPHLSQLRGLARLVDDAADRAHQTGDHRLALRLVELQLAIADSANGSAPTLIGHLVDLSIQAMATQRLQRIALSMPPEVVGEGGDAADVADRLITRLLGEDDQRQRLVEAMIGERWWMHHTAMSVVSGQLSPSRLLGGGPRGAWARLTRMVIGPYLQYDTLFILKVMTAQQTAVEQASTWPAYQRQMHRLAPDLARVDDRPWLHPISAILLAYDAGIQTHYRLHAERRMMAIALAIRQYEAEHGQRPAALEDLVPRYLATVPRDPFADDGRAIGYQPAGVVPMERASSWNSSPTAIPGAKAIAVLYSLGVDGVDEGGEMLLDSDYTLSVENDLGRDGYDMVVPLDPLPEPPPTAPSP